MTVRACFPHNFKRLLEYDASTDTFRGFVGKLATSILDVAGKLVNKTIEIQADNLGVGVYSSDLKHFDGCLGEIQQNRSDIMIQLGPYPMNIGNVSQGLVIYETNLAFVSAYNKTEIGGLMQVLKSFDAFSPDIWTLCISTCLVMSMLLIVQELVTRTRKHNENGYHHYQVIVHCSRLGSIYDGCASRRVIFICASLFSLLVVHYFCSMIKTELVVIKDPLVFKSYDDIIERGAVPLFFKGMSYDALFRDAKKHSSRKRLWKYAMKSFGEERLYADMSPLLFLVVALSVLTQKAVVILDDALMPLVRTSGCSLAGRDVTRIPSLLKLLKQHERIQRLMRLAGVEEKEQKAFFEYVKYNDLNLYSPPEPLIHVSRDEQEQSYFQGLIYTAHSKTNMKLLESATRIAVESGLVHHQLKSIEEIDLFDGSQNTENLLGPPLRSRRSNVERCKSKSIIKPTPELKAIKMANLRSLFTLVGLMYSQLFILLAFEIEYKKLFGTQKRDRRHLRARIANRPARSA